MIARDPVSRIFHALADPTRRQILERLSEGPLPVGELARPYRMSPAAVSKHLKVLEAAGLVRHERHAQWRPRWFDAAPLQPAAEWLEAYRAFWANSFDSLAEHLGQTESWEPPTGAQGTPTGETSTQTGGME